MRQPSATEKYKAVTEGKMAKAEFVRQMRQQFPNIVSTYDNFDSTVKVLKYKGMIFEAWSNPSKNLSDDSIRRGLDIEIAALGHDPVDCTDAEVFEKAKAKAIANIEKDPLYYYNLLAKESSKTDKNDKFKETKRGKLEKDTFNDMKKATLKERKENLVEGTRALIGYLSGDRLTTTYNHYDGYPSNLGVGLDTHYNDDEKAKDVAMKGYITYMDPDTGEIEATHKDAPGKLKLPEDVEERAREIAEEIDKMGADYGYIWVDEANMWTVVKNTGIRSMIDQIVSKISEGMYEGDLEETEEEYLEKRDAAIKKAMGKDEMLKESLSNVIAYLKQEKGAGNEVIKDFIKTHGKDIAGMSMDQVGDEFEEFLSVNYEAPSDFMQEKKGKRYDREEDDDHVGTNTDDDFEREQLAQLTQREGKGKDHDGDGDIDSDDYMAAKDKAIKKAMGKKVNEMSPEVADVVAFLATGAGITGASHVAGKLLKALEGGKFGEKGKEIAQDIHNLAKTDVEEGQINERGFHVMRQIKSIIQDMAADFDGDELGAAEELIEAIAQEYGIDFEFGAGENRQQEALRESVKNIITKVLEEQVINEAATNELARIGEEYADFEGLKGAVLDLQNIVSDIEAYYDKTRDKIQKVYDRLGEIKNEEGLKVGAFLAPSIESAFNKDLRPVTKVGFTKGLDTPKVKQISQADIDRGYVQQEAPKDTVFSPVNEKKK